MNVILEHNAEIPMRDGTILRADIYRPQDDEKHPAIVLRLPYLKERREVNWGHLSPIQFAKRGYVMIWQDTRGTGESDGEYNFYFDQNEDGYDTIEWAAVQPWCDGNVGAYGHSYFAYTVLTAAALRPPHLKAIAPFMQSCLPKYSGGFLPNALHADWLLKQANRYLPKIKDPQCRAEAKKLVDYHMKNMNKEFMHIPEIDMPAMQMFDYFPYMKEYRIKVAGFDDPKVIGGEGRPIDISKITTPALMYCGLYDTSSKNGPFENFITLTTKNPNEYVRKNTRLVVGPWNHGTRFMNAQGELSFPGADGDALDVQGSIISFFDHTLRGIDNAMVTQAPIRLYVMGLNKWRDEYEWPLARTQYTPYYLHSQGSANTLYGDGILSLNPQTEETADSFVYDPQKPVPAKAPGGCAGCIQDYRTVEERDDVLVYSTPVLEEDVEASGPVSCELYISSSAPDTDFFCRLVDVHPNGKALNITEGIVRARYNNTFDEKLLQPGEIRALHVNMGNTSIMFRKGHKIRLEVTSSSFPMYDRNHNTGNRPGVDTEIAIATNTVHHSRVYASRLVLPIIPAE